MARVPDSPAAELDAEQQRLYDAIAGARGGVVRGPFAIWLRNPAIADRANQFGNTLRLSGRLDRRLFELMVLVIARHWSAQYEWYAHEGQAREHGVSAAVIEALRAGRTPSFTKYDEQIVYELVSELLDKRTVSQPTYDRALAAFGLDMLIELTTAAGFYTMVAMMLNTFDAPVPGEARPLPPLRS